MANLKQKFRAIKKFPSWIYWLPARLLQLALKLLYRVEVIDTEDRIRQARGCVVVTWHNRLCFFSVIFPKCVRQRTVAVVSASRDGQYIADLIAQLGMRSLRGSSSRRGVHALLEAFTAIQDGYHVTFTPDGPRGPKYRMKPGPVLLASRSGRPVIPISVNASRYWQIRSWDNFQIPKPGAKLTLVLGRSISIPTNLTEEEQEYWRREIEDELNRITIDREDKA